MIALALKIYRLAFGFPRLRWVDSGLAIGAKPRQLDLQLLTSTKSSCEALLLGDHNSAPLEPLVGRIK